VLPELQPEFDKMKLRVETALEKQKLVVDNRNKTRSGGKKGKKRNWIQRVKIESIGLFF
jgi:hypothetical protein